MTSLQDALNDFKALLEEDPPSVEEIETTSRKDIYDFSSQDRKVVNYIVDSCSRLSVLCDIFYGSLHRSGDNTTGEEESWSSARKFQDAMLIPVPGSYDVEDTAALLSYASLYSTNGVLVLPHKIDYKYISYSGGSWPLGRISSDTVLKTMLFNLHYRNLVEIGHVVFLPRELETWSEGVSNYGEGIAQAPLLGQPQLRGAQRSPAIQPVSTLVTGKP